MFCHFEPNFIGNFLWKIGFSNIWSCEFFRKAKINFWPPFWNRTEFWLFFFWNMVIIGVCIKIYGVKIILKCRWESGFLCTNGRSEYLMQLNVNRKHNKKSLFVGVSGYAFCSASMHQADTWTVGREWTPKVCGQLSRWPDQRSMVIWRSNCFKNAL